MSIDLVTGVPGAGKTLYAVSQKLAPLLGQSVVVAGVSRPRQLMIGGVRDLLLEHDPVDVPEFDVDAVLDPYGSVERLPGQPPVELVQLGPGGLYAPAAGVPSDVPLVRSALNWWLWCEPGQVIVIDECQRLFRPMASGKKIPRYIAKLETHRHYGVDFLLITQHPQLLHVNVRNLVGSHEHVRRIFGRGSTVVYQWDHCTNPDRTASATKRIWRHDKRAYSLYKSAEVHTKHAHRLPLAVYAFGLALCGLGYAGYVLKGRLAATYGAGSVAASSLPASGAASSSSAASPALALVSVPVVIPPAQYPVYGTEPLSLAREPYAGRGLQLEGTYVVGGRQHALFGVVVEGRRVAGVTLAQIVRMGYSFTELGPCAGLLRHGDRERVIACPPPSVVPGSPPPSGSALSPPAPQALPPPSA